MLHTIDGKQVFVVEFDTMPELPITGLTINEAEKDYNDALYSSWLPATSIGNLAGKVIGRRVTRLTYAAALTDAIENGIITEPGKYGIYLKRLGHTQGREYEIYAINE